MSAQYTDDSIKVLSDIEHIRHRSSMYISTDRPSYQMWTEIADNAVDEAMNGHATKIIFEVDYDKGSILVEDNGRGLPQGDNKDLGKPTVFAIYQKLNAGGKYDQESYAVSGGLNGVGSTVVNALSRSLSVVTWRDSSVVSVNFEYGQEVSYTKFKDTNFKGSGTRVSYTIDKDHSLFTDKLSDYVDDITDKISLLKTLLPKVDIVYNGKQVTPKDFRDFLQLTDNPLLDTSMLIEQKNLMVALNWSKDTNKSTQRSYCNAIFTPNGGDHERAVYDSLTEVLGPDALLGINIAVFCMYPAVEYDSQAKTKAISKPMRAWIKEVLISELKSYFRRNTDVRDIILALLKKKRNDLNKRNNKSSVRRDKKTTFLNALGESAFADCTTKDRSEAELFIVEGNSAAGSARQARDVETQAVAPLRGKFINSYNSGIDALLKNREVQMLLSSIDCGAFEEVNVAKSRYGKIIIFTDADPDGANIAALLISFFMNVAPELIQNGYLYLALPPLYGTSLKDGTFVPINDEETKNEYLKKGYPITRFKGLGEMDPDKLAISCMNKDTRSILKLKYTPDCANIVEKVMGGDSSMRRQILIDTGVLVEE